MSTPYDSMKPEDAYELQMVTRLGYEARENRKRVLAAMDVDSEETLLAQIQAGEMAEHPTYEYYLAARILGDTHEATRTEIAERLREINQT